MLSPRLLHFLQCAALTSTSTKNGETGAKENVFVQVNNVKVKVNYEMIRNKGTAKAGVCPVGSMNMKPASAEVHYSPGARLLLPAARRYPPGRPQLLLFYKHEAAPGQMTSGGFSRAAFCSEDGSKVRKTKTLMTTPMLSQRGGIKCVHI